MKTYKLANVLVAVLASVSLMFQGLVPVQAAEITNKPSIDISKVRVPEIYGSVKQAHKGGDKVIFYLQDAHCNLEAQQNNARILEDIIRQYGIDTVCVEGAAGPCETDELASYPNKEAMQESASYFLNQGRLTGAEYLAITGDDRFALIGLEDKPLYDKNKAALLTMLPSQSQAIAQTTAIKDALNKIADKMFSADLKAFCDQAADYRNGKTRFTEYAQAMRDAAAKHGVDISGFANFALQGKSFDMEGTIDFDAVEDERAALVDEVSKKLSKEEASNLVVQSLSFRLGRLGAAEYYDVLKGHCEKAGVDFKSKANLIKYIDYVKVFDQIDKDALVDEASAVEASVKDKLFTSDDQRKLDKMIGVTDMLGRMFEIKLGIRDHKIYVKESREIPIASVMEFIKAQGSVHGVPVPSADMAFVAKSQEDVDVFYNTAVERDEVLFKNAVATMKEKGLDRMAMVTGGFHTGAVTDKLKQEGYSIVVITPRITDFDVQSPYLEIIKGEKTPFEKAIAGMPLESHTMPPELMTDPDAKGKQVLKHYAQIYDAATDATKLQALKDAYPGKTIDKVDGGVIYQSSPTSITVFTTRGGEMKAANLSLPADLAREITPAESIYPERDLQARTFQVADAGRLGELKTIIAAKYAETAVSTFGKAIGASISAARAAAIDAAIAAGRAVSEADVIARYPHIAAKLAELRAAGKTVTFKLVSDTGVLTDDGMAFDAEDTIAHGKISNITPDSVEIGLSEALFNSGNQDAVWLMTKEIFKSEKLMAGASEKEADITGLMQADLVVPAHQMGDLNHYIDHFLATGNLDRFAKFVAMASDKLTKEAKTKNSVLSPEEKAFADALADRVQADIPAVLLSRIQKASAADKKTLEDALAAIQGDTALADARSVAKKVLSMSMFSDTLKSKGTNVGFDLAKGEVSFGDADYDKATKEPIAEIGVMREVGHTQGFTFQTGDKKAIDGAILESAQAQQLNARTAGVYDAVEKALAKLDKANSFELALDAKNIFPYEVDASGKPTAGKINSGRILAFVKAALENAKNTGKPFIIYSTDIKSKDGLVDLLKHGAGIDVVKLQKEYPKLFYIVQGTSAENVSAELDKQITNRVPVAQRIVGGYQGDTTLAALVAAGYKKVLAGQPGVPLDLLVSGLLSGAINNMADFKVALARDGFTVEEQNQILAVVDANGGMMPPAKSAASVLSTMDPRTLEAATVSA